MVATQTFLIFNPTRGNDPIWYFSDGLVQPPTGSTFAISGRPFRSRLEFPVVAGTFGVTFFWATKKQHKTTTGNMRKQSPKKTRELFPKKKSGFAFKGLVCRFFEKCTSTWWIFVYRFEAAGSFAMILNACLNLWKELSKTPPPTYINNYNIFLQDTETPVMSLTKSRLQIEDPELTQSLGDL